MKAGWKLLMIAATVAVFSFGTALKKNKRDCDDSIKFTDGFSASVYSTNAGRARHMA
jgi:hypothetical protein